jgi:Na+/H+ antiporter NhaD/arsenite permease-like protein
MLRVFFLFLGLSVFAFAQGVESQSHLMFTWIGIATLVISLIGYYLVVIEHRMGIDKSVPALFTGVFLFILIAFYYYINNLDIGLVQAEANVVILEIAEIFFFLFVAMTYIETLVHMNVFDRLKYKLVSKGYDYKKLFWLTGFATFFISPLADNLTTALVMSTVLVTIERKNKEFLIPAAINIVVAANAGGAWSPFGDITTIMAWTAGKGAFVDFLMLFPASFIGYIISAYLLSKIVPDHKPEEFEKMEEPQMKTGAKVIMVLAVFTIFCSVFSHQYLAFSAMWGMMFGLALLKLYSYFLKKIHGEGHLNVFDIISKIEHNTLMFFFGVLAVVGALYFTGWLDFISVVYHAENLGATYSNILVGILSAFVDNIPVMSAVLRANPDMDVSNWLLLTLTTGIGGSLISFGSAAGIAMMGRLRGIYTFQSHLRYSWIILVGYFVSVFIWYIQFNVLN